MAKKIFFFIQIFYALQLANAQIFTWKNPNLQDSLKKDSILAAKIEKDVFLEMLKESIAKAYKKNYMIPEANVRVEINEKTGKINQESDSGYMSLYKSCYR